MTKREDYIQEVRREAKLTDEEWRKAWREGRYNGGGDIGSNQAILKDQITKILSDPRIAIIDPEQAVSLTTINNAPVGLDEVSQVIAQGYRKVIPKEEYIKEV